MKKKEELSNPKDLLRADDPGSSPQPDTGTKGDRKTTVKPKTKKKS
jgi:hypothetical protein